MAVSVDTVYQKVLALANKEQRGYITPQEFNLFADQAQMEIFEQYFYDTNQFKRASGNDSEYHDMVDLIDEKLYSFKKNDLVGDMDPLTTFPNLYKLGDVYALQSGYTPNTNDPFGNSVCVEEIKQEDLIKTQNSPLTRATNNRPIYYIENNQFRFFPASAPNSGSYRIFYIVKPAKPNWTYLIDSSNQNALYNSNATDHQDFELHPSEEPKLVIKILQLAGVNMKDYNLAQLAGQKEASVKQQEKQ